MTVDPGLRRVSPNVISLTTSAVKTSLSNVERAARITVVTVSLLAEAVASVPKKPITRGDFLSIFLRATITGFYVLRLRQPATVVAKVPTPANTTKLLVNNKYNFFIFTFLEP